MKILTEVNWSDFDCTAQARENLDKILEQVGVDAWERYVCDMYSQPDADEIADDLHHEWEEIFRELGVEEEEDEDEDEEEGEDED